MSFDLEAHLKSHAFLFEKLADIEANSIHFNFSFLDLQFLDKDVEKTMSLLLNALLLPTSYNVPNGKRKNKHDEVIQKFTTRQVNLQQDVQALAIHLKGPEGEDTMPHIHFIANGSARFGNGYSLLKKHVSVVSERFGLLPNFDEMVEHNPLSVKSLSRAVSQITWSWKKSTNIQLKQEIHARGLDKSISLLESYCLKTKNLTYYIKSMEGLKTRLNRMKLDITYNEHNLRNTYPIPLTDEDMAVIKLLQKKTFGQKIIQPFLKNPIFRDFIRHSAGTTKPYIFDTLKEQTTLLQGVSKNKLAVSNYQKLMSKETPLRKSQLTPVDNQRLSRKNELRRIILDVCKSAINERVLKERMHKAGFIDFTLKKKKGKVIGCSYIELKAKRTVNFTDLGLHWADIKKSFAKNIRKIDNGEQLVLPVLNKIPLEQKNIATILKEELEPKSVPIAYKVQKITEKKIKATTISKLRRFHEKEIPRLKEKIRRFENIISNLRKGISNFTNKIAEFRRKINELAGTKENHTRLSEQYSNYESKTQKQSIEITKLELDIKHTEEEQSRLTGRCHTAGEMEYKIDTTSDALKGELEEAYNIQSNLENGDYEYFLHQNLTKAIGREEGVHKDLEEEIKQLETEQTIAIIVDTPSPASGVAPGF